jgi:hypothetical protein
MLGAKDAQSRSAVSISASAGSADGALFFCGTTRKITPQRLFTRYFTY